MAPLPKIDAGLKPCKNILWCTESCYRDERIDTDQREKAQQHGRQQQIQTDPGNAGNVSINWDASFILTTINTDNDNHKNMHFCTKLPIKSKLCKIKRII